jgi:hypothetical protein
VASVADALSCLEICSLKIQITRMKYQRISQNQNTEASFKPTDKPMNTALIFKEQVKVIDIGRGEKGLDQPHYSIKYIGGFDLLWYKYKITNKNYIPKLMKKTIL